ncbi:FMN-binding protein [Neobacillus mesonae]|uniref:FMN-binding protein n=1 Tax=Neobacillus mesonae TaxID=1193713 RepID=UPI00203B45AC|nr:FMN-binding protein [Neobacillus mesonae]MCM3570421.1 FMN-binding protein [Neobacillus mesonae]
MAKLDRKWVVLCSAAVTAVYAAGYFSTEDEAAKTTLRQQPPINIQTQADQTSLSESKNQSKKSLYKNGTFTGMGENRRGSIEVAVTIQNDKITDVEISDFAMHYSESDVVGLPDEVLQNQNAQVTNVSGATYSTEAFQDAVQAALDQALNI